MKEIIQSRQNPKIRFCCGLLEKKNRRESGLFRLDGIKLCREALQSGLTIHSVYVRVPLSSSVEELISEALASAVLTEEQLVSVSESVFDKLSEERSPEGVVTVAELPRTLHTAADGLSAAEGAPLRLLLAESIRDPGNLGTVIRTCGALGIDRLILTDDCADLYHPRTVRSAMGALFRLPITLVEGRELPLLIEALRRNGRTVYATALGRDAKELGSFVLGAGDCFVIGNEGHGLSEAVIAACNGCAVIPMREGNESLNAAAAAAICVWETVRAGNR